MLLSRTASPVASTRAPAPSLMPEALPAVTEPSGLKAGFIFASCSRLTSDRTCSSVPKTTVPLRKGTSTGMICSRKRPSVAGTRGTPMAFQGQRVLHFPGDALAGRDSLGREAHVDPVERIVQHAE